jgi:hypothetical protein
LINADSFKAIYKAIKIIADSEFLKSNSYNILYCPDLYKRPAAKIYEYLKLQADILAAKPESGKYTQDSLAKNKKVFIELPGTTEKRFSDKVKQIKQADVKSIDVRTQMLNPIELATDLAASLGVRRPQTKVASITAGGIKELVKNLSAPADTFATLQLLSLTTKSPKAKKALQNKAVSGDININNLSDATLRVAKLLPKEPLSAADADSLVDLLLKKEI